MAIPKTGYATINTDQFIRKVSLTRTGSNTIRIVADYANRAGLVTTNRQVETTTDETEEGLKNGWNSLFAAISLEQSGYVAPDETPYGEEP